MSIITQNAALQGLLAAHLPALAEYEGLTPEAITSAIDYVVNAEQPQLYRLEGHGESALPSTFQEQLEKANMELHDLSLLTVDAIPEDAACLLI